MENRIQINGVWYVREYITYPIYPIVEEVKFDKEEVTHTKSCVYETDKYCWEATILDEMFGSTVNAKGYKVLNPKVGLIYGDGMYLERYQRTIDKLKEMGYAACNLVIGVGGILRNHSRDTLGFAIKATYVEVAGEKREIEKDPVTDHKKKSHKGLLCLSLGDNMEYITLDQCTEQQEKTGLLQTVFKNGEIIKETTFAQIKERIKTF